MKIHFICYSDLKQHSRTIYNNNGPKSAKFARYHRTNKMSAKQCNTYDLKDNDKISEAVCSRAG